MKPKEEDWTIGFAWHDRNGCNIH